MCTQDISSLGNHVVHIVRISTEEKMRRSNALTHIAVMKNPKATVDRTIMKFPREPMGSFKFAPWENRNGPISIGEFISCPKPTGFGLFDILPESLFNWHSVFFPSTLMATEGDSAVNLFLSFVVFVCFVVRKNPPYRPPKIS